MMSKVPVWAVIVCMLCAGCATAPQSPAPLTVKSQNTEGTLYLAIVDQLIHDDEAYAALAHLDEIERTYGPTSESRKLRADALLKIGELDKADELYRGLTRTALAPAGWNGSGKVAAKRADWAGATDDFRKAVKGEPTNADFLNNLGYALIQTRAYTDAEFALRQAMQLAPKDRLVANNLVLLLAESNQPQRLDELFPDHGAAVGLKPDELKDLLSSYELRDGTRHLADASSD